MAWRLASQRSPPTLGLEFRDLKSFLTHAHRGHILFPLGVLCLSTVSRASINASCMSLSLLSSLLLACVGAPLEVLLFRLNTDVWLDNL